MPVPIVCAKKPDGRWLLAVGDWLLELDTERDLAWITDRNANAVGGILPFLSRRDRIDLIKVLGAANNFSEKETEMHRNPKDDGPDSEVPPENRPAEQGDPPTNGDDQGDGSPAESSPNR